MVDPTFTLIGTNALGLTNVGSNASPTFADIDGDGDLDAFVGNNYGNLLFYRNTGNVDRPVFSKPKSNPFGLSNVGSYAGPAFADIDGDGDLDAFVGNYEGNILFYRNTGSANKPVFVDSDTNPFGLTFAGAYASPTFADINGDGDLDAFVGNIYGDTSLYRNIGTVTQPDFAFPVSNPFGLKNVATYTSPTFADIDGDGDLDAFVGNNHGDMLFYRNTGTASKPVFASPVTNPFGLTNTGSYARPTFADIDGDGDLDVFVGNGSGDTLFYLNDTAPSASHLNQNILYTEDTTAEITNIVITDPDATDFFTATLTLASGNSAIGSLSANSGNGETYNAATGVWTITASLSAVNAALAAMTFNPVANGFAKTSASVFISDGIAPALTGTLTFKGKAVNDAPVLKTPAIISYEDTVMDDKFPMMVSTLQASDVDRDQLTYSIAGGTDNGNGTISQSSLYGVLTVSKSTGAYVFVPNDAAIEALTVNASTSFAVTTSDGSLSSSKTLTINIGQSGTTESRGDDTLFGTSGNDSFSGLSGDDIINGLGGADTMKGGLGNDVYFVDNVDDVVKETSTLTTEIDTVNSSINYTLGANLENLILTGTEAINGRGNALDNMLIGNTGANILNGGQGGDLLIGSLGNDIYIIDNVDDVVIESSSGATEIDWVKSSINYKLGSNLEYLTLTGAAIKGTGNSLNNKLIGNEAANILIAGAGDDTLQGGLGDDFLTGGSGKDIFRLKNFSMDTITDFSVTDDTIQLENSVFTQLASTGVLNAGFFNIGKATDANDHVIYDDATGQLFYDADGNGTGLATQIALLGINLGLTNADFVVI